MVQDTQINSGTPAEVEDAVRAVDAAEAVLNPTDGVLKGNKLTLSNGIVLAARPVPPLLLQHAATQLPEPKVPTFINPDRDGREEENPNDPDYIEAMKEWRTRSNNLSLNVFFSCGTSCHSVPEGYFKPEDDGWLDTIEAAGITLKLDSPAARYLSWLRFYAISSLDDLMAMGTAIGALAGVPEEQVRQAVESFRGGEGRPGNTDAAAQEDAEDWDSIRAGADGAGSADGGEGGSAL